MATQPRSAGWRGFVFGEILQPKLVGGLKMVEKHAERTGPEGYEICKKFSATF